MAWKSSALKLLLLCVITSRVWSQHWSFGLNPGGKRELDGLSQTLSNIVERFHQVNTPCSKLGCEEELVKMHRLKGFLGNVAHMDNGHRAFEK